MNFFQFITLWVSKKLNLTGFERFHPCRLGKVTPSLLLWTIGARLDLAIAAVQSRCASSKIRAKPTLPRDARVIAAPGRKAHGNHCSIIGNPDCRNASAGWAPQPY